MPGLFGGSAPPPIDLAEVAKRYPALAPHLNNTVAQWGEGPGVMEFYNPDDQENPNKGKITLQFRDRSIQPDQIPDLAAADMLHYLGSSDPQYQALRSQMLGLRTPQQLYADKENYTRELKQFGNLGSYDDYMNDNRSDAYMRGAVFPNVNPEWSGYLTPEQKALGEKAMQYLKAQPGLIGGSAQ